MNNETKIEWTRVNNDVNGNPRYVCHYINLLPASYFDAENINNTNDSLNASISKISMRYQVALSIAKKIGGKKFHNKQYGGGIVFQSHNIKETEKQIIDILNK